MLEQVPVATNNLKAVASSFRGAQPIGATPTGESIEKVWPALAALDAGEFRGPRMLVLATDGEPSGCDGDADRGRARSKSAVTDAYSAGVSTFVIGVGPEASDQHLRELANLGQGQPADDTTNRFFRVLDTKALASALAAITGDVQECVFGLKGTVSEARASSGTVTLNGIELYISGSGRLASRGPEPSLGRRLRVSSIQSSAAATLDISFPAACSSRAERRTRCRAPLRKLLFRYWWKSTKPFTCGRRRWAHVHASRRESMHRLNLAAVALALISACGSQSSPPQTNTSGGGSSGATNSGGNSGTTAGSVSTGGTSAPGSGGSGGPPSNDTGGQTASPGGGTPGSIGGGTAGGAAGGSTGGVAGQTSATGGVIDGGSAGTAAGGSAGTQPGSATTVLVTSAPNDYWNTQRAVTTASGAADLTVDSGTKYQTLTGFGGCFNEMGWDALSVLGADEITKAMKLLFDASDGANFVYGRLPMGASDYSMSWYTLDETAGDYAMNDFSIARDKRSSFRTSKRPSPSNPTSSSGPVPGSSPPG